MGATRAVHFAALTLAFAAHGGDLDCAERESAYRPYGWYHEIPAAPLIDAARPLAAGGAVALLDEVAVQGDDRIFSYIAWIEGRAAADALGSLAFTTQPDTYAEIRARVRLPDGSLRELADGDVSCRLIQADLRGTRQGRSFAQKRYVIHFPGLAPGGLLHYQIALRHHAVQEIGPLQRRIRRAGDAITWTDAPGDQYSMLIPLGDSPQRALHETARNPRVVARRYPALHAAWVFIQPRAMRLSVRVLPEDAPVAVTRRPAGESGGGQLAVAWFRPALPDEPFAPRDAHDAGIVVTRVEGIDASSEARYWRPETDWKGWLAKYAYDFFQAIEPDPDLLARLREAGRLPSGLAGRALADRLNRLLRDEVADASGQEIRLAASSRPVRDVLFGAQVATATEKALALASLLRAAGIPARMVFVRPAGLPPTLRDWPMWGWFVPGRLLVEARPPEGVVYYDPAGRLPSGAIPAEYQGGEALAAADRKSPEWITLPASAAADNLALIEVDYETPAPGRIGGVLRVRLSGAPAARFREARIGAPPLDERLRDWLARGLAEGCAVDRVAGAGGEDPDLPLDLSARLECGLPRGAGARGIPALPFNPGPAAFELAAPRRRPVDFRVAERVEWRIRYPEGTAPPARAPTLVEGPGFRARLAAAGAQLEASREFAGLIPARQAETLGAALARADLAAGASSWPPASQP